MSRFGSRAKGADAEREVAKLVEGWWRVFEPGCRFVKTPLSGGWGGPAIRSGFRASGDLMTTAVKFPFVIEVKRREGWSWKPFLEGRPSPVWGWWRQACRQADEMDARPMLWFRHNREPWRVLMPQSIGIAPPWWAWQDLRRVGLGANLGPRWPALYNASDVLTSRPWRRRRRRLTGS